MKKKKNGLFQELLLPHCFPHAQRAEENGNGEQCQDRKDREIGVSAVDQGSVPGFRRETVHQKSGQIAEKCHCQIETEIHKTAIRKE